MFSSPVELRQNIGWTILLAFLHTVGKMLGARPILFKRLVNWGAVVYLRDSG